MNSNFERLHEIINEAYAENFSCLSHWEPKKCHMWTSISENPVPLCENDGSLTYACISLTKNFNHRKRKYFAETCTEKHFGGELIFWRFFRHLEPLCAAAVQYVQQLCTHTAFYRMQSPSSRRLRPVQAHSIKK